MRIEKGKPTEKGVGWMDGWWLSAESAAMRNRDRGTCNRLRTEAKWSKQQLRDRSADRGSDTQQRNTKGLEQVVMERRRSEARRCQVCPESKGRMHAWMPSRQEGRSLHTHGKGVSAVLSLLS